MPLRQPSSKLLARCTNLITASTRPRMFPAWLLLGLALRLVAAIVSRGYYHPDEFFNYLEPAFQWAFPEFQHRFDTSLDISYRSYLIIGLHYLLLKSLKAYALFSPGFAATLLKVWMACLSMGVVWGAGKIAEVYHSRETARLTSVFVLLWYYFIFFAPHFLSENYACIFSLLAFYYLAQFERLPAGAASHGHGKRLLFAFGFCLAIATQFRLQSAFFVLYPFVACLLRRPRSYAVALGLGFWIPIICLGLAEVFYKGAPFATFIAYYQINIGHQGLILTDASPWYQLLASYNFQFGEWFFPFFLYFAVRGFRTYMPLAGGSCLVYFVIHCLFPHKEVRFLFPMTPILAVGFVLGLWHWYHHSCIKPQTKNRVLALVLTCLVSSQLFHGFRSRWRGNISGDTCSLLEKAGSIPAAQHVVLVERGYHCGYFSLGRDIPITRVQPSPQGPGPALASLPWQSYPEHLVIVEASELATLQAALRASAYEASPPIMSSGAMALLMVAPGKS